MRLQRAVCVLTDLVLFTETLDNLIELSVARVELLESFLLHVPLLDKLLELHFELLVLLGVMAQLAVLVLKHQL